MRLWLTLATVAALSAWPSRSPADQIDQVDWSAWDALLLKHVTDKGLVDYRGFAADKADLDLVLEAIANTDPGTLGKRDEKLAYWINAYNAWAIWGVLKFKATGSVKKAVPGKADFAFFDEKFVNAGGETRSLNDIEHKIVRPTFKDPRVHAALNCTAKSCPKLRNRAFVPKDLSQQLDAAARAWIEDDSKNRFSEDKGAELSMIFEWYDDDFKDSGGPLAFCDFYSSKVDRPYIQKALDDKKVSHLEYDWTLNAK